MLIKLEDNTPPVYTQESRDFQLFLRLYDTVFNTAKFDIDSAKYLTDTSHCRESMLKLLQTKVGLFTSKQFSSEQLRLMIDGFPIILKHKGSVKGIKEAVNIFIKCYDLIDTQVVVEVISSGDVRRIRIGLDQAIDDFSVLAELIKYVKPTGYDYEFYHYSDLGVLGSWITNKHKAEIFIIGDTMNASIRTTGTIPGTPADMQNRTINAVDTAQIYGLGSDVTHSSITTSTTEIGE